MDIKLILGIWVIILATCKGNIHLPGAFYALHTNSSHLLGSNLERVLIGSCVGDAFKGSLFDKNNMKLSDLFSFWCSHYELLADCIEKQAGNISYFRFVFNTMQMKKNGRVVCERAAEIGDGINCLSTFTLNCEKNFTKDFTVVDTLEKACSLTYDMIPCYMEEFKVSTCKDPNILYQILDLLQVFLNPECKQWKKITPDFCTDVANFIFPEESKDKLGNYCRNFTQTQLSCFYREVKNSVHLIDRLVAMEIWNSSFLQYREKKCIIMLNENFTCLKSSTPKRTNASKCQKSYRETYLEEARRLAEGETLTSYMMCKKHQQQVECLQNALKGCPSQTIELFVYTVCASMPFDCACQPLSLQPQSQESSMHSSTHCLESSEIARFLCLIFIKWFL